MRIDVTRLDDEQLLRAFREGDVAAFEELVARHRSSLYTFILRSVRDPETALDLTQETLLRVIHRGSEFAGASKVKTWLFAIARNLCTDHARRSRFRNHASLEGLDLSERIGSALPRPDRAVTAVDIGRRVEEAVDGLPSEQREVFLLRELGGLAFGEIAELTQTSENTVKSRMRYALERLQRALGEYADYVPETSHD